MVFQPGLQSSCKNETAPTLELLRFMSMAPDPELLVFMSIAPELFFHNMAPALALFIFVQKYFQCLGVPQVE